MSKLDITLYNQGKTPDFASSRGRWLEQSCALGHSSSEEGSGIQAGCAPCSLIFAIDFVGLRRLVSHLLEKGVDGIVVCGTTGEAAALAKHEQLAVLDAVLERVPAKRVVMGLAPLASGKVDVLCGEDRQIFSALCLGATGAIAASAHIHPQRFVALYQQIRDNQLAQGRTTFFQLLPLINSLFIEPNPAPVKTAPALEGLIGDELRAPMQRSSEATARRLKTVLAALTIDNR